jgi:hypothetical protein
MVLLRQKSRPRSALRQGFQARSTTTVSGDVPLCVSCLSTERTRQPHSNLDSRPAIRPFARPKRNGHKVLLRFGSMPPSRWTRHCVRVAGIAAVALALAACGGSKMHPDASVRLAADAPPAPSTWASYPRFPSSACWVRQTNAGMVRAAPSVPFVPPKQRLSPSAVAAAVVSQLGDRRYVHRFVLAPVPAHARRHARGYFAGVEPPADALWGYAAVKPASMIGSWEGQLVAGAVRDRLCANGGPPMVAWTVGRTGGGFSDSVYPFEQHFPNPSPVRYRSRVGLVARRYGFGIVELRLLHPFQLAPLLVVYTDRPRAKFIADVPAMLSVLDPRNGSASTFEGFYFEARDKKGPFVRTENSYRGTIEGGQWSADPNDYPFPHG